MKYVDNLTALLHVIRVIKWSKVRWVGVTAFSSKDEKSIKYRHGKIGKVVST